jgi:FtsH-binding integral membrane protein
MNKYTLYAIPVLWTIGGILYARSLPKDGFSGVGEVFFTLLIGLLLFIVVTYVIKNRRAK